MKKRKLYLRNPQNSIPCKTIWISSKKMKTQSTLLNDKDDTSDGDVFIISDDSSLSSSGVNLNK